MNITEPFYGVQMVKRSINAQPMYNTVLWGQIERRGVKGIRTYTSNGYVYIFPTDYYKHSSWDAYSIQYKDYWDEASRAWTPYVSALGPGLPWVNGTVIRVIYKDTYWGRSPSAAAKAKAYSQLQSNMCNYAMLTKDLRDGLHLAQDYFDRVLKAAPYIKRKQFRKASNAFFGTSKKRKAVANTWLEFQWGVKPTIEAVQTALQRATTDTARVIRIVGKGVSERTELPGGDPEWHRWSGYMREQAVCRVYRYFKNNYFVEQAAFNPIEPAFDAVPWSFLVNWFIPIEDYLRQFGYVSIWSDTFGCDSEKDVWDYKVDWIEYGHIGPKYQHTRTIPLSQPKTMTFKRTTSSAINLPLTFAEMLDRGSINMSIKRLLNTTALVTQRL